MRLSIDEKLLNKLVNYIGTRPFQEVFKIINEIQNDVKPIEPDDVFKNYFKYLNIKWAKSKANPKNQEKQECSTLKESGQNQEADGKESFMHLELKSEPESISPVLHQDAGAKIGSDLQTKMEQVNIFATNVDTETASI